MKIALEPAHVVTRLGQTGLPRWWVEELLRSPSCNGASVPLNGRACARRVPSEEVTKESFTT